MTNSQAATHESRQVKCPLTLRNLAEAVSTILTLFVNIYNAFSILLDFQNGGLFSLQRLLLTPLLCAENYDNELPDELAEIIFLIQFFSFSTFKILIANLDRKCFDF